MRSLNLHVNTFWNDFGSSKIIELIAHKFDPVYN